MSDQFQAVSSQSWFSRLGSAIKGILVGLLFILGGVILLFWNEGRAVHRAQTLEKGASQVISVNAASMNAANDGKLVHLTGEAKTDEVLKDPKLGVSTQAIRLSRRVEMYQWTEHSKSTTKKKLGGGTETVTTYSYDMGWSSSPIDSSSFANPEGHTNPPMPFSSDSWQAEKVRVGAFELAPVFINKIPKEETVSVDSSQVEKLPEVLRANARISDGSFYFGKDPAHPAIGDLKISFSKVPAQIVSIVGLQQAGMLTAYPMKNGSISLLEAGTHSADEMFQSAKTANKTMTWILRVVGILVLFMGFGMLFKPLAVLADVVPFIGSLVGVGMGVVSFFLALGTGVLTIAIGWLAYRPLLGISLLILAGAVVGFLLWLIFRKKGSSATVVPPPPPPSPSAS